MLVAALALLGVQRVPCFLGAAAEPLRGQPGAQAPCHAPPPSLPSAPARESDPTPACSGCPGVRALVFAGPGSLELPSGPAPLLPAAVLLVPAGSPRGFRGLHPLQRARAPDRAAATTVLLL